MKKLKRGLLILSVGVGLFFGLILLASESGEVVVLSTLDENRDVHETRLWIVEHDGALWLRSGAPNAAWLRRLRRNPNVSVVRAGVRERYRAVPSDDAGVRDAIHERIAEKYGLRESLIRVTRDGSASVPVRLEVMD